MIKLLLIYFNVFYVFASYSQGCSDAGFCSIGNNPGNKDTSEVFKHKISTIFTNGIGDDKVFVSTPAIQYDYKINKNLAFQSKVAGNYANGNLASIFGLGDLYLAGIYKLEQKWNKSFMLGFKIPLNNANLKVNDLSLPMQYQSSLGTLDLLTGVTLSNDHWQFSTALQLPLSGANKNEFRTNLWDSVLISTYPASNFFNRKGDVLLRFKYLFNISKKIKMNTGLLGIYHLGNDSYIDIIGNSIQISGSEGLTLNITGSMEYKLTKQITLGLSTGFPVIIRKIRPDGLTRAFVLSPEFVFHF